MADKMMKEHLYGDLLAPCPGYATDFAMGMTYSLSFEAMLTAHLAFGMLGEMDDNAIDSPHLLLEAITKNSDKVVVFCNKGGIAVPPTIRKVYSLLEKNIFEVFDSNDIKANFHPKLWVIREVSKEDKNDILIKIIVTSRNLSYTDTIDCVVCLTGKVGNVNVHNQKHESLSHFIKEVVKYSNIGEEQKKRVLKLTKDIEHVEKFDVDAPFDDYDFFPYLFKKDFSNGNVEDYLVGTESIIVSPFIEKGMIDILNQKNRFKRTLITRKEYVDPSIFNKFNNKGGVYVCLDDLASRGMDLHAKMYYVWDGRENQYLFLGSANATSFAFNRNGEFLIRLKYKKGNSKAEEFLREFYEEGNADSRFIKLNEANEEVSTVVKWDAAESAMKKLMCAEDLQAKVTKHRTGDYSVTITSSSPKPSIDVFFAPIHLQESKLKWTGRISFDGMKADELSEFYIVSATNEDGLEHKSIIKVATTGIPEDRDKAIFQNIIKSKRDFFRFIELMLTDCPLQYISSEMLLKENGNGNNQSDDNTAFTGLYEKMLMIAANNPHQLLEIGRIISKLGDDVVPDSFTKVYKHFVSAI